MNLFSEIEGLSGEDLVTAILRVLLLRSEDIRGEFIRSISKHCCRLGPLTAGPHFSCLREEATYEEQARRTGRIDLILETADAAIGIENKLGAGFQEDQPHKYLATLEKRAKDLAKLRGRNFQYVLVILAPASRSTEIKRLTGSNDHYVLLTWEDVKNDVLKAITNKVDPATGAILDSFVEFLDDRIAFVPRFKDWVPHLRGRFDPRGSELQREIIYRLGQFFPDPSSRVSRGENYCGSLLSGYRLNNNNWLQPSSSTVDSGMIVSA